MSPAFENNLSEETDEVGMAKYTLAIRDKSGKILALSFHQLKMSVVIGGRLIFL